MIEGANTGASSILGNRSFRSALRMTADDTKGGIPFGRYRIRRRLGSGGMGEVFLADQLGPLGPVRPVALKRMRPPLAHDAQLAGRFLQEMGIAARLNHPNIAVTHDFGEVEGVYFMAMEYIEGASLDRLLVDGALPVASALLVAQRVAEALAHAHEQVPPVVHQDVSPHNVMVGKAGQIKLLDFGIAAAEAAAQDKLRAKAPYAAPEQLMGRPPERRFDLWALGILLYEMVTGRRPFQGPRAADVLQQIRSRSVLPIEAVTPDAAALSPIVRRALDPVPDRRWASAREFAEACALLLARREASAASALVERLPAVAAPPPTAGATGTAAALPETGLPEPESSDGQKRRRGRLETLFWPLVVLALGGAGLGLLPTAAFETRPRSDPVAGRPVEAARDAGIKDRTASAPVAEPAQRSARKTSPADNRAATPSSAPRRPPKTYGGRSAERVQTSRRDSPTRPAPPNAKRAGPRPRAAPAVRASRAEPNEAGQLGMLSVRATPWARVELDGLPLGEGIIAARPVSAGIHVVRLIPGEGDHAPKTVEVRIEPGRVTKVFADFAEDRIRVRPAE